MDREFERKGSLERLAKGKSRAGPEGDRLSITSPKSGHEPSLEVRGPAFNRSSECRADRNDENTDGDRPFGASKEQRNAANSSSLFTSRSQRPRTMSPIRRPNSSPASKTSRTPKGHRSWIDPFRSRRSKSPPPEESVSATEESLSVGLQTCTPEQELPLLKIPFAYRMIHCLGQGRRAFRKYHLADLPSLHPRTLRKRLQKSSTLTPFCTARDLKPSLLRSTKTACIAIQMSATL